MKQIFVRNPVKIVVLRFYDNKKEIREFLKENNERHSRDYGWEFCTLNNEPFLKILTFLPESGVYSLIGVHHGDYISVDEEGTVTYISQKDIKESYSEIKPKDKRIRFATFDGYFSTIMSFLDEANREYGYDRYKYYCDVSPSIIMKISDRDSGTSFSLMEEDILVINKDGTLLKIPKEGDKHERT